MQSTLIDENNAKNDSKQTNHAVSSPTSKDVLVNHHADASHSPDEPASDGAKLLHSRVHALQKEAFGGMPKDASLDPPRIESRAGDSASDTASEQGDADNKKRKASMDEASERPIKKLTTTAGVAVGAMMSAKRASMGELMDTAAKMRERSDSLTSNEEKKTPGVTRERTSRYLSEGDRREIISRIDRGEKQVALAKEYCVSRAAICNLYKNRHEVLTRSDRDPDAKHPKKNRKKTSTGGVNSPIVSSAISTPSPTQTLPLTASPLSMAVAAMASSSPLPSRPQIREDVVVSAPTALMPSENASPSQKKYRFIECCSRSNAIKMLLTVLRNRRTSSSDYRHTADRVARLMIEETLSRLPPRVVDMTTEQGDVFAGLLVPWDEESVCALSMEQKGFVMLKQFTSVQRKSPTGSVSVNMPRGAAAKAADQPPAAAQGKPLVQVNVPASVLKTCKAFLLLDSVCSTGEAACAVIQELVHKKGIRSSSIYFVTLLTALPGLERIHEQFPDVTIVTGVVDAILDEHNNISPGIGNFPERYWNVKDAAQQQQQQLQQLQTKTITSNSTNSLDAATASC